MILIPDHLPPKVVSASGHGGPAGRDSGASDAA